METMMMLRHNAAKRQGYPRSVLASLPSVSHFLRQDRPPTVSFSERRTGERGGRRGNNTNCSRDTEDLSKVPQRTLVIRRSVEASENDFDRVLYEVSKLLWRHVRCLKMLLDVRRKW